MSDDEMKALWQTIEDPVEALEAIADGAQFLGGDPYYADLVEELVKMAVRVAALARASGHTPGTPGS